LRLASIFWVYQRTILGSLEAIMLT
jgi:hypothetical protein